MVRWLESLWETAVAVAAGRRLLLKERLAEGLKQKGCLGIPEQGCKKQRLDGSEQA
jgi:hypothetical protein